MRDSIDYIAITVRESYQWHIVSASVNPLVPLLMNNHKAKRMTAAPNPIVHPNDTVQLRKTHPCGSDRWRVYRVGTDIGLECLGCKRRVLLTRSVFNKRVKKVFPTYPSRQDSISPDNL
jgi:hypothetical protein